MSGMRRIEMILHFTDYLHGGTLYWKNIPTVASSPAVSRKSIRVEQRHTLSLTSRRYSEVRLCVYPCCSVADCPSTALLLAAMFLRKGFIHVPFLRRCIFIPLLVISSYIFICSIRFMQSYDFSSIFSLRGPQLASLLDSDLPSLIGYDSPLEKNSDDLIYILFWTKRFHATFPDQYIHNCARIPAARCLITSSRSFLNRSAALIFHARDLHLFTDIPKLKYRCQKYIFFNHESPLLTRVPLQGAVQKRFFDWTMTYRKDSTIYCPYAYFEPMNHSTKFVGSFFPDSEGVRPESGLETRPKLVAWFVSNCETDSKRERYVHELQKHIPVDVYGHCGTLTCEKRDGRKCLEILAKTYKFYIGFENSVCTDYISEKFATRLDLNLVIIVLRRSDYENMVPEFPSHLYDEFENSTPGSFSNDRWANLRRRHKRSWWFFIAADDFDSPKDLAEYLKFLNDNPRLYLRYFEWRRYRRVVITGDQHCFCELCSRLYEERQRVRESRTVDNLGDMARSQSDIYEWWNVGACVEDFAATLVKRASKN